MKKIWKILLTLFVIILLVVLLIYLIDLDRMSKGEKVLFSTWGRDYIASSENKENNLEKENIVATMDIVTSLEDETTENSAWCGTFNLIWNDLKNDLAKRDIIFNPQPDSVNNLNKGTFNTAYLSENSYYKVYGNPSLELKETIEKAIKEKFNETSDILDDFSWQDGNKSDYFLYAMLKKEFEFPMEFTELENGKFGDFENIKYFGINEQTSEDVRNQVQVLYYYSEEEFAIKLLTKGNDEVIISKGSTENNFLESYKAIENREKEYLSTSAGEAEFLEYDTLKIPNINIDLKQEFTEVEQKPFLFANGDTYIIDKALQTIKFDLDKKGGKIKSEAGMSMKLSMIESTEPRNFIVDDTFNIYLKEEGKDLPYFAARISDISKLQK